MKELHKMKIISQLHKIYRWFSRTENSIT